MALACETNLANILATLAEGKRPDLVVVDSIQTLWADGLEAAPGTVSQVRAATQSLIRYAKAQGAALVLVGHVTKDGQIAGPKVIEHMVDTVLYFEGDRGHAFRILRAAKNRFGATDEIGVFEMAAEGLREVANPSELFLGDRVGVDAGLGGVRRHGGDAADPGRDPGAGGALGTRHAAARGGRLGHQPARHAARRHRCALRRQLRPARRLSQCRRRPEDHRAGRRPRRRRGPAVVNIQCCARRRAGLLRGNQPVGRGQAGRTHARAPQGSAEAGVQAGYPAGRRASSTRTGSSSRCRGCAM